MGGKSFMTAEVGDLLVRLMRLDCRVGMVRNRNPKGKFFHIFGNNLKIRPIRQIKKTNGTTPGGDL